MDDYVGLTKEYDQANSNIPNGTNPDTTAFPSIIEENQLASIML